MQSVFIWFRRLGHFAHPLAHSGKSKLFQNFTTLTEPATFARQAGESLVGSSAKTIEKSPKSKWTQAFFLAPAAGLEPAT